MTFKQNDVTPRDCVINGSALYTHIAGFLRPVLLVSHLFDAVFGYLTHSVNVSLQLGKIGK